MMIRRCCRYLLSPTELHALLALTALAACAPPLFPQYCPPGYEKAVLFYSGIALMAAFISSAVLMILSAVVHLIRLSNVKALLQLLKWAAVWGIASGLFILMAIAADVPAPPTPGGTPAIQETDTLHPSTDALLGPTSLSMVLKADDTATDKIADAPNLRRLESEHEDVLRDYLARSPRWRGTPNSDTFYSSPGHPVFIMPATGGVPGLVHVSFRHLVEGEQLPQGYTVVTPGAAFPAVSEVKHHTDDMALDLGRNHYLLLAWRGTDHAETARRALNATIRAIDLRMQPLAENPTDAGIEQMLNARRSYEGSAPGIRFTEPAGQEGVYQAEVYINPREPGTLLFYIRDLETNKGIKMFYCEAKYSANPHEVFRHDIPADLYPWEKEHDLAPLPANSPVFTIRTGNDHKYFGVALEVWFKPADSNRRRFMLLRRCYNVLPYDDSSAVPPRKEAPADTKEAPATAEAVPQAEA